MPADNNNGGSGHANTGRGQDGQARQRNVAAQQRPQHPKPPARRPRPLDGENLAAIAADIAAQFPEQFANAHEHVGRPTRLTPDVQLVILENILAGVPCETAAEAAGIASETLWKWLMYGKGADGAGDGAREPYKSFRQAVRRAQAIAEVGLVQIVRAGDDVGVSNGPARGAQWLLERTRGNKYAPRIAERVQSELEMLLDAIERVCAAKDCGCYEAVLAALAACASGEAASGAPGAERAAPVVH